MVSVSLLPFIDWSVSLLIDCIIITTTCYIFKLNQTTPMNDYYIRPKGVMISFKNMTDPTFGIINQIHVTEKDRYLSYLPISHGMERWIGECVPFVSGEHVFFADSLSTFVQDLGRCKPTLFLSVPRLWTKFQQGVFKKMEPEKLDKLLKIPLVSWLVKRKLLKALGLQDVRYAGSGSAPLPSDLLAWYRNLGLELLEGYGMTENFNCEWANIVLFPDDFFCPNRSLSHLSRQIASKTPT